MNDLKSEYSITVADRRIKYSLTIKSKFTFIVGNSGVGKTTLFNLIRLSNKVKAVSIESELPIIPLDHIEPVDLETILNRDSTAIFIIDEESDYILSCRDYFMRCLTNDRNNLFIIMCRDRYDEIPRDSSDLMTFKYDKSKNINILTPYYDFEKLCKKVIVDRIITEDKKSGNRILSK